MADLPGLAQTGDGSLSAEPSDYGGVADVVLARVSKYITADLVADLLASAAIKAVHGLLKGIPLVLEDIGKVGADALIKSEDAVAPLFGGLVAPIIANMFGTEAGAAAFASRDNRDGRQNAARLIVNAFFDAITGNTDGEVSPDTEPAKAFAAAGVHAAIEGWFNAFLAETLGEMVPVDWLRLHDMMRLPEEVISALGVGRLVRGAIRPLVNATATVPMTWATNKKYRPGMIAPALIVHQFLAGKWDENDVRELLARHGYTEDMITALIDSEQKRLSLEDLFFNTWHLNVDQDLAIDTYAELGWDRQTASKHLIIQGQKRVNAIHGEAVSAAVTAYVEGRIEEDDLDVYISLFVDSKSERAIVKDVASTRHALHIKGLSPAEAEACALAKIVPISDYEDALRRAGYSSDAVDALELLLRAKIDAKSSAAEHKTQLLADRAAAQKAKADAAAEKKALIDAARAHRRLGSIAELEHAVITGLIPIARLEEVLTLDYDPETVAIYVADVEAKRVAYVEKLRKAAGAATAAASKGLSIGELTAAVLENVLTVDQVRAQLVGRGVDQADVDVLAETLAAKKADHDAAVAKRAHATTQAKTKRIDLARMEALVRLGARTTADYAALVASLGYDDASVAAMVQLLELKVSGAKAATNARASITATNPAKGLTLTQFRRAVIAGAKTLDAFQTFLVQQGYTSDAISTLTAELADDVAAADAARSRRTATSSVADTHALPLSALTRAARLGVVTPGAYEAELVARGYSADDVALELALLSSEIATAQATRRALPTTAANVTPRGLSLGELAKLVKGGHATIDDYQARALAIGYSSEDAAALAALLADDVATLTATSRRHVQISGELAARSLSIAEVEAAVKGGTQSLDDYATWLSNNGYGAADVALLRALLESKLPAAAPPAGG